MAFSINIAIITGNVTREPELKFTPSGTAVCTFGVATNYSIKKGDKWEDVPCFHNIVVWGKQAEWLSNNLQKGSKASITGRINNRSYDGKDGTKRYVSEIIADTVVPFGAKGGGNPGQEPTSIKESGEAKEEQVEDIVIPDEMPF